MKVAGWNWKVNADGFVTYAQPVASIGELSSYCQVFRSGCVESVCAPFSIQWQSDWAIHAELFEQQVHGVVRSYREELGKLGVVSPLLLCVSLLQAKGMRLASTSKSWGGTEFLDRNALHLPEVLIEDTATPLSRQLRPAFDGLWNAFGCWQSAHFDAQGNWLLKHD
jgi:hypothetical protein